MRIGQSSIEDFQASVIAVPPLARDSEYRLARAENEKLIHHIEAGGISILMYGGNANFYNLPPSEYEATLSFLADTAGANTWVIPSVGPDFGRMIDQAPVLERMQFPTAMILPNASMTTEQGTELGIRKVADRTGHPIILYLRSEQYLPLDRIGHLHDSGHILSIKYAIVRKESASDDYLRELISIVGPEVVSSGIGERPAVDHFNLFGLTSFTSGSACIAPRMSMGMFQSLKAQNYDEARGIRERFLPLENLRDTHHPARVLHDAVTLCGVADMGPILPLLSNLEETERQPVRQAAINLLRAEREAQFGGVEFSLRADVIPRTASDLD